MIAELATLLHRTRRLFSRKFWGERFLGPLRNQDQAGVVLVKVESQELLDQWIAEGYRPHPLEGIADPELEPFRPQPVQWPLALFWHIPALARTLFLGRWQMRNELLLSELELRLCAGEPVVMAGPLRAPQMKRLRRSVRQIHARHYRIWPFSDSVACLPHWIKLPDRPLNLDFLAEWARLRTSENGRLDEVQAEPRAADQLRVMVYNVHACVGTDGRLSPKRVAEVIARFDPDIIALQELDQARPRSHSKDQTDELASYLQMHHHFHAAMELRRGQYGNAVLSKRPVRLVKAGPLPKPQGFIPKEPRGAMWVELDFGGRKIQLINTHLGLQRTERLAQIQALVGPDWVGACEQPLILCGDFNAGPNTPEYQILSDRLRDIQGGQPLKTWFGRYPVRVLDYLFVGGPWKTHKVFAPRTTLTIEASDHLPLIVDLSLEG